MSKNIYVVRGLCHFRAKVDSGSKYFFFYIVYVFECHLFSVLARKIITVIIITEVIILSIKL